MTRIFMFFIYLSTFIAITSMLIVCVSILIKASSDSRFLVRNMLSIDSQVKILKIVGIVFTIIEWFLFSCEKKEICLEGYAKLSDTCFRLSVIWIVLAFICIIINMALVIRRVDSGVIAIISRFRNSAFIMGTMYSVFSFILNV